MAQSTANLAGFYEFWHIIYAWQVAINADTIDSAKANDRRWLPTNNINTIYFYVEKWPTLITNTNTIYCST